MLGILKRLYSNLIKWKDDFPVSCRRPSDGNFVVVWK
jgi:hypothetical protein